MATLEDLRRAAELLPPGASLTLSRESFLAALANNGNGKAPASTITNHQVGDATEDAERWLSAKEVAARLEVSPRYVYAHRRSFPFTKELPGGAIRFSERGLRRWMERQQ